MHFETFRELSLSNESYWSTIVAPYLAESIFNSSKVKYEDISKVPDHISSIENTLTTILYEQIENNSNPTEIKRVYLWFGTREQAKSANCSGIDKYNGKYVVVQTTLPDHDIEFYDRYEIIQDSDPLVGGIYSDQRINKVLTSSPRGSTIKELTDNIRVDVIQDAVEKVVENLMEKIDDKQIKLIAIYETKRTMRRGDSTIFENINILLGNEKQINDLGEKDDGSFSSSEIDDESSVSGESEFESESESDDSESNDFDASGSDDDHAEATDFLMRKLIHGSSSSSSEHESEEEDSEDEEDEFTYDERVDSVVLIHNKLVPLLDDIESNKKYIIPLLKELQSIGTIDVSEDEDDSELDPMPDLENVFNQFSIKLTKPSTSTIIKESEKVEEVLEELD
jgi:hypothetical protein